MIRNILKLGVVAAGLLAAMHFAAVAINVDPNRAPPARVNATQQSNYYRATVNFNDPSISTGQRFGRLPKNAFIISVQAYVVTAFNATGNTITIGTSADAKSIVASGVTNTTATFTNLTSAAGLGTAVTSAADTDLYARYTQTGTAATAGQIVWIIEYIPDNDL